MFPSGVSITLNLLSGDCILGCSGFGSIRLNDINLLMDSAQATIAIASLRRSSIYLHEGRHTGTEHDNIWINDRPDSPESHHHTNPRDDDHCAFTHIRRKHTRNHSQVRLLEMIDTNQSSKLRRTRCAAVSGINIISRVAPSAQSSRVNDD